MARQLLSLDVIGLDNAIEMWQVYNEEEYMGL